MSRRKRVMRLAVPAVVVCVLVFVMVAASGSNITSSDPLISLSYLTGPFKTQLLDDVQTALRTETDLLSDRLERYATGVKRAITTSSSSVVTTHTTAAIPSNSSYWISSGSEFLVLSGSISATAAGLTDVTEGTAVSAGSALTQYHLYTAAAGLNIKASDSAKILLRK